MSHCQLRFPSSGYSAGGQINPYTVKIFDEIMTRYRANPVLICYLKDIYFSVLNGDTVGRLQVTSTFEVFQQQTPSSLQFFARQPFSCHSESGPVRESTRHENDRLHYKHG